MSDSPSLNPEQPSTRPWRVLHLIDHLGCGGAQTLLRDFLETTKEDDSIFLTALRSADGEISVDHPNVYRHKSPSRFSLDPLLLLRRTIRENNIDLIHCHLFRAQVFGWLIKKIWFRQLKLIFHEHGEVLQWGYFRKKLFRFMQSDVDLFIAVSTAAHAELLRASQIPDEKIRVILNALNMLRYQVADKSEAAREVRERFNIPENHFLIGFVGRLEHEKGCDYLIQALPLLEFPACLLIVGDGQESETLADLSVELGVQERVIFSGFQYEIAPILSAMDVLALPSRSDACPRIALEAQALGIPVVASNVGGVSELLPDTVAGLFFEEGDVTKIAQILTTLFKQPELRQRLTEGGKENIKKFDACLLQRMFNEAYPKR